MLHAAWRQTTRPGRTNTTNSGRRHGDLPGPSGGPLDASSGAPSGGPFRRAVRSHLRSSRECSARARGLSTRGSGRPPAASRASGRGRGTVPRGGRVSGAANRAVTCDGACFDLHAGSPFRAVYQGWRAKETRPAGGGARRWIQERSSVWVSEDRALRIGSERNGTARDHSLVISWTACALPASRAPWRRPAASAASPSLAAMRSRSAES